MPAFRSAICHKFHSIFIISVIDVRESIPSIQEAPIWIFLSHVSYISFQIRPMMHMKNYIILPTHPRTFRLPIDSKLQEEDAMWHIISSFCGPHSLHVSPCSVSTSIFSCIYLRSSIIKYLFHSNVWTLFISSRNKIPNVSILTHLAKGKWVEAFALPIQVLWSNIAHPQCMYV